MSKSVLQDLIEPVESGFWGEADFRSGLIACRVVRNGDVTKNGYIPRDTLPVRFFSQHELAKSELGAHDIVLVSSGAYTGNSGVVVGEDDGIPVIASNFVRRLRPKSDVNAKWAFHLVRSDVVRRNVPAHTGGSAIPNLQSAFFGKCVVPPSPPEKIQEHIAEVLSNIDDAIAHTEELIAKTQQIKSGLMHDLFTRGVTPDGQLRPSREEAPELYQESPLGWVPKEWSVDTLESLLAPVPNSIRSGPFGSALLKNELVEDGIPFLGIDNIHVEQFVPTFRRFVSEQKFIALSRYRVRPRDVVITIMGTVGRCCVIPGDLELALSSKHLWTMTFDQEKVLPELVCWQLNHSAWVQAWFRRWMQGGIMDAIQSSTLKTLKLPVPRMDEQVLILQRYIHVTAKIETSADQLAKLNAEKLGLMHDLLTGRVTSPLPQVVGS